MYPHIRSLCNNFIEAGWSKVEYYKTPQILGQVEVFRWKEPCKLPPRGSEEDSQEFSKVLVGKYCNSLKGRDIISWGLILKGKI